MTFIPKFIFIIFILLFGLALHLKNHLLVALNYYIGEIQLSFSLVIVLAICVGVLLGILVNFPIIMRIKKNNHKLEKKLKNTEKEINSLRVTALKD